MILTLLLILSILLLIWYTYQNRSTMTRKDHISSSSTITNNSDVKANLCFHDLS